MYGMNGWNKPDGDLISRAEAIDALSRCQTYLFDTRDTDRKISLEDAEYVIEKLPSAQPEWIPVTDRLPEEKTDVLLAFKNNMAVGFWEDILRDGVPAWYANSGDGWMTDTENVDSDGIPIAWMPLPEPWKGEDDE